MIVAAFSATTQTRALYWDGKLVAHGAYGGSKPGKTSRYDRQLDGFQRSLARRQRRRSRALEQDAHARASEGDLQCHPTLGSRVGFDLPA